MTSPSRPDGVPPAPDHADRAAPDERCPSACSTPATRRRGELLERAIFDATLRQLAEVGYAGATMEGIAAAAGTGKASLYRRWPSKDALVLDALDCSLPPVDDAPDGRTLREDLVYLLRRMITSMNGPAGAAIRAVLTDANRNEQLVQTVHERVLLPRKRAMYDALERAVATGEARPGCASRLVIDVAPALLVQNMHGCGGSLPVGLAEQIVDEVLLPIVRP